MALAITDLSLDRALDAAALANVVGAGYYGASAWQAGGITTGNWGAWHTTSYKDMGFHSYNGNYFRVYNEYQERNRTQTEKRWRSLWYD